MNYIGCLQPISKHYAHIRALTTVSAICAGCNISAAQSLRIIKRKYPYAWTKLLKYNTPEAYDTMANLIQYKICRDLQNANLRIISQPDHFLLTTNLISETDNNMCLNSDIHFLRTQRRYNKRRYARVRATSRPSFWAGMLLSTLVTAAFWGATMQELDWISTAPILIDVNFIIFLLYIILGLRFFKFYQTVNKPRGREYNKSKRGWKHILIADGGRYIWW